MDEMLSAQKSSWEEKEKLSRQLEEERHNNVNAAIGQVMYHTRPHSCQNGIPAGLGYEHSCFGFLRRSEIRAIAIVVR